MSGSGRRSQYRKGVTSQFDSDEVTLSAGDQVALVTANRGAHIFAVQLSSGTSALAKLPTKFHNVIWVKPRDYVVVETSSAVPSETETHTQSQVSAEGTYPIKLILSKENIKSLKKAGQWPSSFEAEDSRGAATTAKHQGGALVANDLLAGYGQDEEEEEYEEEEEVTADSAAVKESIQ